MTVVSLFNKIAKAGRGVKHDQSMYELNKSMQAVQAIAEKQGEDVTGYPF